jgi:UDPglucose 6-dehydrogenase
MQIVVIGTGYVGLVTGTCFAELGMDVVCVDKDKAKIEGLRKGVIPIYEPGLDAMVEANASAGRLTFVEQLEGVIENADAIFIAVGTPTRRGDGYADLQYVYAAVDEAAALAKPGAVLVTKSTVPPGTGAEIKARIAKSYPDTVLYVASNPEFLREGSAIEDFMRPDRVVFGTDHAKAEQILKQIYYPLEDKATIFATTVIAAEIIKYAANAFLATKIAFINEVADLCEAADANVQDIARGIGLDERIGSKFLQAGPGYGGSCFPKDTLAFLEAGKRFGVDLSIVQQVVHSNDKRKDELADRIASLVGPDLDGKTIAVLGLTFKADTDDMRESPAINLVNELHERGATIQAYDPQGMEEAEKIFGNKITYCDTAYCAVENAHALTVVTEWNEFKAVNLEKVKELMAAPNLIDLRNLFDPQRVRDLGFIYSSIGRN